MPRSLLSSDPGAVSPPRVKIGSSTVVVVLLTVVVVPFTVIFPVTVRLSATVVSLVLFPMVIAVPLIPVPIDTDSLELAVSMIRYASLPCLIVKAVAESSETAILMSVPSAEILSRAMSPTLVIAASLKEVAPSVFDAAVDVIPPLTVVAPVIVRVEPSLERYSPPRS